MIISQGLKTGMINDEAVNAAIVLKDGYLLPA